MWHYQAISVALSGAQRDYYQANSVDSSEDIWTKRVYSICIKKVIQFEIDCNDAYGNQLSSLEDNLTVVVTTTPKFFEYEGY